MGHPPEELLETLGHLEGRIAELDQAVRLEAERRPDAVELMRQRGVGPVTALAFVLTLGPVERFPTSRQLVSYLGLNPAEASSGGRQRLGHISKQGNATMRWLLVEAAHVAAQSDGELRRHYLRLRFRRGAKIAKVAIARRLAVRMYWRLRQAHGAAPPVHTPSSPGCPEVDRRPSLE